MGANDTGSEDVVMNEVDVIREALYAATRGPDLSLAPVAGTPVGDAHLALDALAAELMNLRKAYGAKLTAISGAFGYACDAQRAWEDDNEVDVDRAITRIIKILGDA